MDRLRKCRHGCGVDETLNHVLLECSYMDGRRTCLCESLHACDSELSVASALGEMKASEDCEKLLASFLDVFKL